VSFGNRANDDRAFRNASTANMSSLCLARKPLLCKLAFLVALAMFPLLSRATNITLQGSFTADDNVQLFSVSVSSEAAIDIRSYGYAGGITSTGTVVPRGGFDTILTLFDGSGMFLDDNDDGAGVPTDPTTGLAADARLTETLTSGKYIVALTEYDNFSIGNLVDGFAEDGHPNFTANPSFTAGPTCADNMFRDISGTDGACRNGNWTVTFDNVASVTAVPEPSVLVLGGLGLGLLLIGHCRRLRNVRVPLWGVVVAFLMPPVHAQTASGPDYSNVPDFLNGQRNLIQKTDLEVFRVDSTLYGGYPSQNIVQIYTSNSTQNNVGDVSSSSFSADASRPMRPFSAHMFNQAAAITLTTMNSFQHSENFALWLQNVTGLPSHSAAWEPLAAGDNPTVTGGAVADFTQDGYDDLAIGFSDGRILVLAATDVNDPSKQARKSVTNLDPLSDITAGDFKGDGQWEIAGLSIQNGGLKLLIYSVDIKSLVVTRASSLTLTTPDATVTNPIAKVSIARGRFNNVGHDQLAVAFATNSATTGFSHVEIIDFTPGTLTPFEASPAPLDTPDTAPFNNGYIQVKTGKFSLPNNTYDSIVYHSSSPADQGRYVEILKVDPTSLAVTETSPMGYNKYPCAAGIDVGNFDNQETANGQSQSNPNSQVALLYCSGDALGRPDYTGYSLSLFNVDPTSLRIDFTPVSTLDLSQEIFFSKYGPASITFAATDLQGRSIILGEPTKVAISNTIQPSVVIGVPPMHVDYIDPGDGNGPRVFNVSVVPDGFKTTYNQASSSSYASNTTNTTSWSFGAKETASVGFTVGDPDVSGLSVKDIFTAAQNLKGSHEHDQGAYSGKSFNLSATTGFGDEVSYSDSPLNIWIYPVIGQTVCPAAKPKCKPGEQVPLTLQYSAPNGNAQTEAIEGQDLQWYQPPWEPGNVLSYPANFDQLQSHYPNIQKLTNDTTGILTDGSTIAETVTWSGSSEESDSAGLKQNYSFENDFSVNGATEIAGIGAEGGYGLDLSGSFGFNSLYKSTTTLGKSTGLEISKPGTFPAFQNYGYSVKPYIIGTVLPANVVDNQPLSPDILIQGGGLLRAVFTADPLSEDPPAGGWWQQAYSLAPDVALNHPSRWTYSSLSVPSNGDIASNCLAVGDGKSMDCAELNQRSPSNPWLSIFHFMRGFFISNSASPGQGPQLEQAKADDVLTLQTRVYNYSLATMPNGTEVHVRFYFMPWNTRSNLPSELNGKSYLINEETVGPIPPFNESSGPDAHPNWRLVSTTFDTSKFAETRNGNAYLVFWVVVWMQDGTGNLVSEMPAHGLTAIPPPGTTDPDGETTIQFSGFQPKPGVTQFEECQSADQAGRINCYSNNLGFYKQVFYIAPPLALGAAPGPTNGTVDIGKIEVSASQVTTGGNVVLSAILGSKDASAAGVSVNFYDGDPQEAGRLFAVEQVPYIEADAEYMVQTTYKSDTCGVHQLFAVVNQGKPSQVIRRAHPVRVDCNTKR
jgi:hypothetical protein